MAGTKILVTVDGSTFAESVIPSALKLAETLDASVEYLSVFEDESILAGTELTATRFKEWLNGYLADLVDRTTAVSNVSATHTVIDGLPAERIVEYAKRSGADYLAMSTHGRGAVSRAWLGSVADRVVRHIDVPVLLVRAREGDAPALTQAPAMDRIVVPLDGSERAEQSLEAALQFAKAHNATLVLLRAVAPPTPFASPYMPHAIEASATTLDAERDEAERYLAETEAALQTHGIPVVTEVLVGAYPAHGVLHYVQEHPTDLIAITSHGRGGLSRAFLGSVADKLVRASTVPVLLTRAVERGTPLHAAEAAQHSGVA